MSDSTPGSKAPLVVFGGMLAIGITGVVIVMVSDCRREEPYLDPQTIEEGSPDRMAPRPVDNADEVQKRGVIKPAGE